MFKIAALYNFVAIERPIEVSENIKNLCEEVEVTGSLILAK